MSDQVQQVMGHKLISCVGSKYGNVCEAECRRAQGVGASSDCAKREEQHFCTRTMISSKTESCKLRTVYFRSTNIAKLNPYYLIAFHQMHIYREARGRTPATAQCPSQT